MASAGSLAPGGTDLTRRSFVGRTAATIAAAGGLGATAAPGWCQQAQASGAPQLGDAFWAGTRSLQLLHANGDYIEQAVYMLDGRLYEPGYLQVCRFFRDRVTGEAVTIDTRLLDILYGVQGWLRFFQVPSSFILTSGHRSARRNRLIEGAALHSKHITGEAADGRIPGVSTKMLAEFARWLGAGGVGWYPHRGFVHVDTGRTRSWRG